MVAPWTCIVSSRQATPWGALASPISTNRIYERIQLHSARLVPPRRDALRRDRVAQYLVQLRLGDGDQAGLMQKAVVEPAEDRAGDELRVGEVVRLREIG